ncbi:MAG: flagellin [Fusobacteriaceae bacterium]|nr:flagellin domain protein [Fusobacteriales bacterium]MDN5305261.1 flagellin [Fusobacteriaceae bacterium]
MRINHNMVAENAYRSTTITNTRMSKEMEKLSSGLRINRSGDDAAGLAISEKMRGQISGLKMSSKNSQDAISLIQTAEGALNETHSILQRMRELAVQAVNDTNTDSDRKQLQKEMDRLRQEVDRIANTTEFNTKKLFTGNLAKKGLVFQVGANEGQTVELTFSNMGAKALKINGWETVKREDGSLARVPSEDTSVDITSAKSAEKAITIINNAIEQVSDERAKYGAMQNRLEHTIKNLDVAAENLQTAESRIRDADMAKEMVDLSKDKIISQSGTAMLAQANTQPQSVLQLLR